MSLNRRLFLAASGTTLLAAPATLRAQAVTLRFGHVLQPDHPYHKMAERFAELLREAQVGITVQIFPGGQLGNERTLIEGLQLGSVDVTTITSAVTANFVPEFNVFNLPFLFRDTAHLFAVMDSRVGTSLAEKLAARGLISLGYGYGGARDLYTSRAVRRLPDLAGMRIRTIENPIVVDTWRALGAAPTPIPWNDVFLSLRNRVVDGAEGTGVSYKSMGFDRLSPFFTRLDYLLSWHNVMLSNIAYQRLSPAQREAVARAGTASVQFERELFVADERALFGQLAQAGVTVINVEDRDAWAAAVQPVYARNAARAGGQELIDSIRAA